MFSKIVLNLRIVIPNHSKNPQNRVYITPRFGLLANRVEMINFGMLIHSPLNYKTDLQGPNHSRHQDKNLRDSNVQTKHPKACNDTYGWSHANRTS